RTTHLFGPSALAWSTPAESWSTLLRQRRRWLRGLLTGLTPRLAVAALAEALVYPALLILLLTSHFSLLASGFWLLSLSNPT
ncbi:MAG TPA: hypothetical protein V6D04_05895, partial [Candidatus Obscuribacterales bacterium]